MKCAVLAVLLIAAFGAGTAAATLSIVNAAEAPRAGLHPVETLSRLASTDAGLLPASPTHPRSADRGTGDDRQPFRVDAFRPAKGSHPGAGTATPSGLASWYDASGMIAAAGPALRVGHWRGRVVTVCAGTCVRVTLSDWCQCHKGRRDERLIDLSDDAFSRLAPLTAGLVRVQVVSLRLPATDAP